MFINHLMLPEFINQIDHTCSADSDRLLFLIFSICFTDHLKSGFPCLFHENM